MPSKFKVIILCSLISMIFNTTGYAQDETTTPPTTSNLTNSIPTDAELQKSIHEWLPPDARQIEVRVIGGTVYLSGLLYTNSDYEYVVFTIATTPGVKDVNVDKLTTAENAKLLPDLFITVKVKSALLKSNLLGAAVPLWPIQIQTVDSQVYLSGTIHPSIEKDDILSVVQSVPGVAGVQDEIFTDNDP